jgi:hypothetical protein
MKKETGWLHHSRARPWPAQISEADPRFVHPANDDFHLGDGSRAIDNGLDGGIRLDLDGLLRPQGQGFDIGAFEFGAAPSPNPDSDFSVYLPLVEK